MFIEPNEFITDIPLIDRDHQRLIQLLNNLIDYVNKGKITKATFDDFNNKIVAYSIDHLDAEEYLMRSLDYPLYTKHCEKHNIFRENINNYLKEVESQENISVDSLRLICNKLVTWFKFEVLNDDIKLAMYIRGKNSKTK